ncbi:zinc-ribbon domain-containing protein [Aaestuariibius violaceus]|uniref:zinc-ribbon domain-containing protein n=1 Tax=Aestuariibius violaceus TaxID=3234132 RepID=UPI00347A9460
MRLTCPNCGAEYEVSEDAIPTTGRDVQCSNCGDTWFQAGLDAGPQAQAAAVADVPEAAQDSTRDTGPDLTPPPLDPAVAAILKEEREFEERARDSDALESQQEMDLSGQPAKSRIRRSMERAEAAAAASAGAASQTGSRRKSLPDIEEINSTLDTGEEVDTTMPPPPDQLPKSSGFWLGFGIAVIVVGLLAAVYFYDDEVLAAMPSMENAVTVYVGLVDSALLWIDGQMQNFIAQADPSEPNQ